ncbi:glycosyltransferase [Paenibacillus sp. LHD-38]|uniref:glycosyltransferase family 2 protein n=1 Tax=Paenibacillus sp. LHD-38 TaxID=3072143 RepID=UPI00280E7885|nr:glycosyltransferase [Paenibacillus sp. LHD-38]MDQ8735935.1 glycosyltransferase [Paenibacillus sp. LHD-38]
MPKISIIVPIFNVEKYLSDCIDSILTQTFTDIELILVNDGSPDKCGEICEEYAIKDNRIKVIHKENKGVSSARNSGIEMARGEYIAFVDPDDTIEPNMYEVLLYAAVTYDADIVVCPIRTINNFNNKTSISTVWKEINCPIKKQTIEEEILPSILVEKTYSLVSSVNKLYKKTIFESTNIRYDEQKNHSEDAKLNFTILPTINILVYVEQPLYNYYIRKRESLSNVYRENMYFYVLDNKRFLIELCNKYNLNQYINIIKNHYTGITLSYMQDTASSDMAIARKHKVLIDILLDKEFSEDILIYKAPSMFIELLQKICIQKKVVWFINSVKFKNIIQKFVNKVV